MPASSSTMFLGVSITVPVLKGQGLLLGLFIYCKSDVFAAGDCCNQNNFFVTGEFYDVK